MSNEPKKEAAPEAESASVNFIEAIINEHNDRGRFDARVHTRFPPEPNGYLHIGHAMSILLNYGIAQEYGGKFNLRFDDTNPVKEEQEYVDGILHDVKWLGADWENRLFYTSDYFGQLYDWAIVLIKKGLAYVDDLSADETREYRGTLTEPGKNSPYRDRTVEENLDLFERMKNGEFPNGARTLRAKIDMASGNIKLRDPVMYRIIHAAHHNTGDKWCLYPLYDWAHGQSDSLEGITHSICTIEYEIHRPLYDWFIENLGIYAPQQIEFAPLNLSYTVLSKRRLIQLVNEGHVNGWDDPRMPTVAGMRRRGYPSPAVRAFIEATGVGKSDKLVDIALLEYHLRQVLNKTAQRVMGVLEPLKVVITNYPEGQTEMLDAVNNPEDESMGSRQVPFSRELYVEQRDFMEDPPRKFFRLAPGREVRLRYGYFITCQEVVKDENGEVIELHCTYDPETRGGYAPDGRRVRGTLHWVSAAHALDVEVRLYDRLYTVENPLDAEEGKTFLDYLNPNSLKALTGCKAEPFLADAQPGDQFQFERNGYFNVDITSAADALVFNRTVTLRDTWARIQKQQRQQKMQKQRQQKRRRRKK